MQEQLPEVQVQDNLQETERKDSIVKTKSKKRNQNIALLMYSGIWILTGYFIELIGIKILDGCKLHIPKVLLMLLLPQIFELAGIRLKEKML